MNTLAKTATAAAAALVVAILGYSMLPGNGPGGQPTPSPTAVPTATPPVPDFPTAFGTNPVLYEGTYALTQFPVDISFEIPAYEAPDWWNACSESVVEQNVCHFSPPENISTISFQIVDNVVANPCGPGELLRDPPVGPSVDDLVAGISSLEGYVATTPKDITVDGFRGKEFTLTAPQTEGCGATWATSHRTTGMGPGEVNIIRILDVNGVRVVITNSAGEVAFAHYAVNLEFMDSIRIQP